MYLTEQYHMYHLAYHLVTMEQYDMLHMNQQTNEVWLEKQNRKVSTIIRFVQGGFDWKNHLKADVVSVFQRVKAMGKLIIGKKVEIYNIYITEHEPVDDWETLKKPMMLKAKKSVKMNLFYLSDSQYKEETKRLFQQMALRMPHDKSSTDEEKVLDVSKYKQELTDRLDHKSKEFDTVFSYGKPRFVYVFIAFTIFMFLMLELNGGSTNIDTLIQSGAKYNPAMINGEWWRIITSMFLHIGAIHLFMNMLALYYLGIVVERIYGSFRFVVIYFLAGIGAGLTSFAFHTHVSAGASGAIFGLFGALLFFGMIHKKLFLQTIGKGIVIVLAINLVIGLVVPQIDMGAHLGGLITGFIAAIITHLPRHANPLLQTLAIVCYLFIIISLMIYGTWMNMV
jgi:rhomboid protease GluP